jgi:hypothetical protein
MEQAQLVSTTAHALLERLQPAQNAHDLKAFLACFAPHIQGEHPAHPERAIRRIEQVRKNWSALKAVQH